MAISPGALVGHRQSHSLAETLMFHFHNARCSTGFMKRFGMNILSPRRIIGLILLPFMLINEARISLKNKGFRNGITKNWYGPAIVLAIATLAGQLVGTFFGPGSSPKHLQ